MNDEAEAPPRLLLPTSSVCDDVFPIRGSYILILLLSTGYKMNHRSSLLVLNERNEPAAPGILSNFPGNAAERREHHVADVLPPSNPRSSTHMSHIRCMHIHAAHPSICNLVNRHTPTDLANSTKYHESLHGPI